MVLGPAGLTAAGAPAARIVFLKGSGKDSEPARSELFPRVCKNCRRGREAEPESSLFMRPLNQRFKESWDSVPAGLLFIQYLQYLRNVARFDGNLFAADLQETKLELAASSVPHL
jgi:hypothetical protein